MYIHVYIYIHAYVHIYISIYIYIYICIYIYIYIYIHIYIYVYVHRYILCYIYKDPYGNHVSGLWAVVPMEKPRDPDPRRALPSSSRSRNLNPQARMAVDGRGC